MMNKKDREILQRSLRALQQIPAQGNAVSMKGSIEYSSQVKFALGHYAFLIYALEENDYEDAWKHLAYLEKYSLECEERELNKHET